MKPTRDYLRRVRIPGALIGDRGYRLDMWDTGQRDWRGQTLIGNRFWRGQTLIGYRFWRVGQSRTPLFEGEDFAGSPLHSDDSDQTVALLLMFLVLRPGDTEREYFDRYTAEQMAWAESHECEALAVLPDDFASGDRKNFRGTGVRNVR